MYQYDNYDQTLVNERAAQFRGQTERFLKGELSEDQYRPLRLMNGLYIQKHAPMLRIAIPYGLLSSRQLRMLAHIARTYDKGYGHFTTRQNIQFNWPKLEDVPDVLSELATVQMHAIQTSGNCIRNVTSDHLAGVGGDELEDPRPYCEIIRQWSTLHPEFSFLPRKFKIAVNGAAKDRAATQLHDIGLQLVKNDRDEIGFEVLVGGGLGRTPIIGVTIRPFLEKKHLLSYLEAILRVYNRFGRRDNKFKARIKILVKELGKEKFTEMVEAEWAAIKDDLLLDLEEIERIKTFFQPAPYETLADNPLLAEKTAHDSQFAAWFRHNTFPHKMPGYRVVFVSLKTPGKPPGDLSASQMDVIADLADHYSFGEIRVTHTQNLVLADVKQADLHDLWQRLKSLELATPNIGTATDIICCPGLDFCSLANATSIPIANGIQQIFDNLDYLYDLGDIRINVSGCMNGCGHHTVGHIGILGVDKKGEEWYQITLGGSSGKDASLGERLGPSVAKDQVCHAIEAIFQTYREHRLEDEAFLETVRRIGMRPFQGRVYGDN
ncbi:MULTISPECIES: nitrite/sulfite reductase [Methylocaldum]|jgi:sulfite reductase (NADPH) hemoprotein beta-component|uniref:nitrite/sulfite reductase n=1 Tax=unclassified Methylocaldum TaxID=2622260 RepID=UPI000A3298A1|nr:nitrite/sulfite reductase [Methylocaldum sp. RMAD-M]MBP1148473.1 sulfite reductase (NADPH) hemoprotein beta-component [Methylocaldum sp. RMAD-M]MVF22018.1 nitrite/sulfite reductase [Methylocaldum sp. BRCS4]